jgi:hypothetical protein
MWRYASVLVSVAALTACAAPAPADTTWHEPSGVRYRFDGGLGDDRGVLPLRVASAGGAIAMVDRDGGRAVRFPPPCERYGARECARVVLESGPASFLNPGTGPIRFGAAIRMSDGEFKLQVDGLAGRPSCVLVGVGSSQICAAITDRSVANGRWHTIACVRDGGSLTVSVDGARAGSVSLPTTLSVHSDDPLRVGGKGSSANNDQFNGVLDDVYVDPGPL